MVLAPITTLNQQRSVMISHERLYGVHFCCSTVLSYVSSWSNGLKSSITKLDRVRNHHDSKVDNWYRIYLVKWLSQRGDNSHQALAIVLIWHPIIFILYFIFGDWIDLLPYVQFVFIRDTLTLSLLSLLGWWCGKCSCTPTNYFQCSSFMFDCLILVFIKHWLMDFGQLLLPKENCCLYSLQTWTQIIPKIIFIINFVGVIRLKGQVGLKVIFLLVVMRWMHSHNCSAIIYIVITVPFDLDNILFLTCSILSVFCLIIQFKPKHIIYSEYYEKGKKSLITSDQKVSYGVEYLLGTADNWKLGYA